MAIVLEANYAKKLGLPGYSSHQYSVSIRTELTDLSQVEAESTRLYHLLQNAVDQEIQQVGFMPEAATYGTHSQRINGHHSPVARAPQIKAWAPRNQRQRPRPWNCSDRQKSYIQRLVREMRLDKNQVEQLSMDLFGTGVRQLNRLQASGLIDQLIRRQEDSSQTDAPVHTEQAPFNGVAHRLLPQSSQYSAAPASDGCPSLAL